MILNLAVLSRVKSHVLHLEICWISRRHRISSSLGSFKMTYFQYPMSERQKLADYFLGYYSILYRDHKYFYVGFMLQWRALDEMLKRLDMTSYVLWINAANASGRLRSNFQSRIVTSDRNLSDLVQKALSLLNELRLSEF